MKKHLLHFIWSAFIVITVMLVVCCEKESNKKPVLVTDVKLDKTEITLVLINDTEQLTAIVLPENASNKKVRWTSSDAAVATVDSLGVVTAKGEGQCEVTVTTDDFGYTATCQITVPQQPPVVINVTGVTLDESEAMLNIGDTKQLNATVEPENATNKNVTWSTLDYKIATVDKNGVVTAKAQGETLVLVTTVNLAKSDTCKIIVSAPVTGVSFRMGKMVVILGETQKLMATVFPLEARNRDVTWISSNPDIAEIDDKGIVTAKAIGISKITVTTVQNAKKASCYVEVVSAPPYSEYVKTYGSKFILKGKEIIFRGAGQWPGAGWNSNTYQNLASVGFNSVRLYIDARNSTFENPGNVSPGFSTIDNQIALAKENNMTIILNVHFTPGSTSISDRNFFIYTDYQERLANFWKTIAQRYKDEPTIVGFDLINEQTVRLNPEATSNYDCNGTPYLSYFEHYRAIIQNIVNSIREVDNTHIIFTERLWIDPGQSCRNCWWFGINDQRDCWQNYDGKFNFPDISDPAGNYAYTYHCYEPNTYCHQTLEGRTAMYPSNNIARYNEGPNGVPPWKYCKEYLDYAYTIPMAYIREVKNVPVYIGELGIHEGNYKYGGTQYVEDLYDILLNWYKLSSSFHPYNIGEFHPYMNAGHEYALRIAFGTNK